jgi:hypothetical protein
MAEKFDSDLIIPEQVKQTIGRLIVAVAATSEPATKLDLTSSLIGEIKSALKIIIRHWKIESLNKLMWNAIRAMAVSVAKHDDNGVQYKEALEAIQLMQNAFDPLLSKDKNGHPMTKESAAMALIVIQDWYVLVDCRNRWKSANAIYFSNHEAWRYSNDQLGDINDALFDIANKHNMIIIPKNSFFSIDEFNNYGAFKPLQKEVPQ